MAHRKPQKGGSVKKSRLKTFMKHQPNQTFRLNYFEPLINRRVKELLKEKNRQ